MLLSAADSLAMCCRSSLDGDWTDAEVHKPVTVASLESWRGRGGGQGGWGLGEGRGWQGG